MNDERQVETDLLCYTHAALFLGMKRGTLYSLVHQKRIPHVRLGARMVRFSIRELEGWIRDRSVTAG